MLFGRTGRILIWVAAAATLFGALFSSESLAMGNIDSFSKLTSCVADTNETECVITSDLEFTGELTITRNLTIRGDATLSRAASYAGTLFTVSEDASLVIQDLTIDGGASGWEKDLTPENIPFRFNGPGDRAYGGYYLIEDDNDILADAPIINNLGNLTISGSTFQNSYNQTSTPSVISNNGKLSITNSTFQHNVSQGSSTIYNYNTAAISVSESTFVDNNAGIGTKSAGGGAIFSSYGTVTITDSYFENNSAVNDGGAINSQSGDLLIANSMFVRNSSGNDGSAIKMGRGVTNSTPPLDDESTGVLSNLTFSENINLSTYWVDGTPSPNGTIANGNGQGVVAYFNDGYDNVTIKDSSFSGDTTGWGIISLYSCDDGIDPSLCAAPDYLIDNVNIHDEDGSLISASKRGNLTVKNSTLEANGRYAIAASTMTDVVIEDTNIVGGVVSMSIHHNETSCIKGVTIDEGDVALSVHDVAEVEIDGLTIKNSHHNTYPNNFVAGVYAIEHAVLSDINYFDNEGQMQIANTNDTTLTNSNFCSSKQHSLEIGGSSGETNVAISNTSVCRDATDGPAMIVKNGNENNIVSTDINLILGNGFTVTGNSNDGDPNSPESLSSGYGGGLYIEAYDDIYLLISDEANISKNTASIAGNDIFMRVMTDDATIYANIYGEYVEDNADNRATISSELIPQQFALQGKQTLGLSHAIEPEEEGANEEANPNTYDTVTASITIFAIALLCGSTIMLRVRRI